MRDGAAPIAGAQVHVEYGGKTFPIYSNKHGQLPALPHPKEGEPPTKVKVYKPDGTWKTLLELLPSSPPRTGILVLDMPVMVGQTLGHTAPQGAKNDKIPVHYRVKPGDSLSKIASQYRSTPAEIKKLNNLSSDCPIPAQHCYPQQLLGTCSQHLGRQPTGRSPDCEKINSVG